MTSWGIRPWLVAAAVVAAVLSSSAATAESPNMTRQVYEFTPTTANGHLSIDFNNGTAGDQAGLIAAWGVSRSGALTATAFLPVQGGYFAPEAQVEGGRLGCVSLPARPAPVCESRIAGTQFGSLSLTAEADRSTARYVLVVVGDRRIVKVKLSDSSRGWRMQRVQRTVTLLRTQDLDNDYVLSGGEGLEHFQRASAAERARGSFALAGLPCREVVEGGSTGRGEAVLSGGSTTETLGCPTGPVIAFDTATRPTTWRLEGDVWGSTNSGNQATSTATSVTFSPFDVRLLTVSR